MREKYESLALADLKAIAKARGLKGTSAMKKADLIELIFGNNIGNRIPVDCGFIHSNTPRKYFYRCRFSCVLPLLMCLFCSFRSSFQNSACSFRKQRNCRYSNFPYFSGFLRCNRQKSLKYQAFRQIQSCPKPPSKITKQPLTHKTRKVGLLDHLGRFRLVQ